MRDLHEAPAHVREAALREALDREDEARADAERERVERARERRERRERRRVQRLAASVVVGSAGLLAGCIPVPVPWPEAEPGITTQPWPAGAARSVERGE